MSIQLGLSVSPNWAIVGSLVSSVRLRTLSMNFKHRIVSAFWILPSNHDYIQNLGWTVDCGANPRLSRLEKDESIEML